MIRQLTGLLAAVFLAAAVNAGETEQNMTGTELEAIHAEIDHTVWRAFQKAFEELDGDALNAVYAEDVLRITPEGVDTTGDFKASNRTRFDANRERGDTISLDFWLDSRQTTTDVSYNVGFYRVGITDSVGDNNHFYGQFHIVLKRIDGSWKIVQDWDTGTVGGESITAEHFSRGEPVRFY